MTDETARAIVYGEYAGSWNEMITNANVGHLQRMAKFWLMRHKILEHVNEYAPGKGTEWAKLCDKIEALEAE